MITLDSLRESVEHDTYVYILEELVCKQDQRIHELEKENERWLREDSVRARMPR